jgi:hypothetical protein
MANRLFRKIIKSKIKGRNSCKNKSITEKQTGTGTLLQNNRASFNPTAAEWVYKVLKIVISYIPRSSKDVILAKINRSH